MSEAWIEGCPVQRIMFRDGLVISLGDYNEVVIAVPMWLTLPPAGKWPREIVCVGTTQAICTWSSPTTT